MKTLLFSLLLFIGHLSARAQGLRIEPLPCGVWGSANWTPYTEEDLKKGTYPAPVYLENYYINPTSNNVLWLANDNDEGYINNLQCIRWAFESEAIPYKVTISENGERVVVYEKETRGCGLMIFPDSLLKSRFSRLQVVVERKDSSTMYFYWIPMLKMKRKSWMTKLHGCIDIQYQITLLLSNQKYREALSLLEIEKLKNPDDTRVDDLYWKTLSQIKLCPLISKPYYQYQIVTDPPARNLRSTY